MHIVHHPIFVTLSVIVACLGSWTALDLFRRVRAHTSVWRADWLAAAGIAMGLSIWSMHFIAMLGFDPGAEVRYRIDLTLLSLLLAIIATTVAFFSVREHSRWRLLAAGAFMGLGICLMHYVGMLAVITSARIRHDPLFVTLAFAVAMTASTGALVAAAGERTFSQRALAAVVLGFAIVGMHYMAMMGVRLEQATHQNGVTGSGIDPITLAIVIAVATMLILLLALIAALSDRRFEAHAAREALRSEQQLRAIIEHLPFGVFVAASPSGEVRFANAEAEQLFRHPVDGAPVWDQRVQHGAIHPNGERLAPQEHALYQAMHEGRRVGPRLQAYRRGDGSIAQFEVMAAPIPDAGGNSSLAVVAFQDVTMKLIAEEELTHARRLESLGRLTGGVAHDFNNLLTVVIGALDVMLRNPQNAARSAKLGEAALAAARRGERLTAQLRHLHGANRCAPRSASWTE